jgi:hypothetical protein
MHMTASRLSSAFLEFPAVKFSHFFLLHGDDPGSPLKLFCIFSITQNIPPCQLVNHFHQATCYPEIDAEREASYDVFLYNREGIGHFKSAGTGEMQRSSILSIPDSLRPAILSSPPSP